MVGKNKLARGLGQEAKVKHRFTLKKLSLGLVSVAIGSSLILSHVEAVSASENDKVEVSLQESKDKEPQEAGSKELEEKLYRFEFQNKITKGSTTVKAKSAEEAEKYFRKYANNSGLGNLHWSYNDKTLTFTANSQKTVEDNETGYSTKEAAETAAKKALEKDTVNKSYTVKQGANGRWFYLLSPNPVEEPGKPGEEKPAEDNENGYSTKEAAEAAAKKALEKDTVNKSYTVKQGANGRWFYLLSPNPVEEPGKPGEEKPAEDNENGYSSKEAAEAAAKKALEKDTVNKSYTVKQGANGRWFYLLSPNPVEEPGKPGEQKPGEKPGEQKPGEEKPGEQKPGEKPGEQKPGEEKPGEQKPGEQKPGEQKPGEEKPGDKKPTEQKPEFKNKAVKKPGKAVQAISKKPGQRLPNTATGTWALGLFGLTSLASGLFAYKHKKD